jgi:hypothetical protein
LANYVRDLQPELEVNYCRLVVVWTGDPASTRAARQELAATFPFLCDHERKVIAELDIIASRSELPLLDAMAAAAAGCELPARDRHARPLSAVLSLIAPHAAGEASRNATGFDAVTANKFRPSAIALALIDIPGPLTPIGALAVAMNSHDLASHPRIAFTHELIPQSFEGKLMLPGDHGCRPGNTTKDRQATARS